MNCKIVQDLLPNYIDGLTNEETNKYIEKHLQECKECSKVYETMKKDIEDSNTEQYQAETNYLKKYNKKLRIFKIIIIIIVLIFVFVIGRRMIVLHNLQTKMSNYENADNFHFKTIYYNEDSMDQFEIYKLGNKYKAVIHYISLEFNNKITRFGNGETENWYIESGDAKLAEIKREPLGSIAIGGQMYDNFWDFIKIAFTTQITSEKCNGIDCYKLQTTSIINEVLSIKSHETAYYEKSTGLLIRSISDQNAILNNDNGSGQIQDYRYDFGNVREEEFIEPDINEYKIQAET